MHILYFVLQNTCVYICTFIIICALLSYIYSQFTEWESNLSPVDVRPFVQPFVQPTGLVAESPLPFTHPTIIPGSDARTAGTIETRPAEGRVCGSAYCARAAPHFASQEKMMGRTAGPSGMQRHRLRPKLRQKRNCNSFHM